MFYGTEEYTCTCTGMIAVEIRYPVNRHENERGYTNARIGHEWSADTAH